MCVSESVRRMASLASRARSSSSSPSSRSTPRATVRETRAR